MRLWGMGKRGPLTWVAECRVPWESPSAERLAMAQWMIDNGSDVHQGDDGPLGRAALMGYRIPMMELLVRNGADVNAVWVGSMPVICSPCETVEPRRSNGFWTKEPIRTAISKVEGTKRALLLGLPHRVVRARAR